jgi:hypothetical protein
VSSVELTSPVLHCYHFMMHNEAANYCFTSHGLFRVEYEKRNKTFLPHAMWLQLTCYMLSMLRDRDFHFSKVSTTHHRQNWSHQLITCSLLSKKSFLSVYHRTSF